VKVADFGMVKDLAGLPCILTGGITPAYGAPETVDGWVSPSCDQYSLAIVYQELLTGWRPFDAPTVGKLLQQHLWGVPNLAPLPTQDREAVRRALAKHPDDRHACCLDLMTALRRSTGAATGSLAAALTVG
jgi:serine/threonine protein kinase